jgi:hypothetical protein
VKTVFEKVLNFLDGKKSYIGGAIIFLAGGLYALKVIDEAVFKALAAIGGAISIGGIRHAIAKLK